MRSERSDSRLTGLYVITDAAVTDPQQLEAQVALAIRGGARIVQYRDKSQEHARRLKCAERLATLCHRHRVALIINDDIELARASGAQGVHLGREDGALERARARLPSDAIIGISCYDALDRAQAAQSGGAGYVAFGRFFPSQSKPEATPADPSLLIQARKMLELPIVAIGGITPDNGRSLLEAGADMLAVINGVFGQPDIQQAAARFAALFPSEQPS